MKKLLTFLAFGSLLFTNAQSYKKPLVSAITEKDLKTDMYQMAADQFWGREADFRRTESFDVVCR
jgi:hypothetical protein